MIIPIPKDDESELSPVRRSDEWIRQYIDVQPWKCKKCQAKMFGRMTHCVLCKTPR